VDDWSSVGMTSVQTATPTPKPIWPIIIGLLSISTGLMDLACGVIGSLLKGAFQIMPSDMSSLGLAMSIELPNLDPLKSILAVPGWICTALLLFGGGLLIVRKPAGRLLHLIYSALGLLLALVASVSTLYVVMTFHPAVAANRLSPEMVTTLKLFRTVGYAQAAITAVMAGGYPVFLLLWFRRRHVREEVARWNLRRETT
jgi:hypothetical protein